MSSYPGFYYYRQGDCSQIKVRVLRFSSRPFKRDAVIQYLDTGKIETVPSWCLVYGGQDERRR